MILVLRFRLLQPLCACTCKATAAAGLSSLAEFHIEHVQPAALRFVDSQCHSLFLPVAHHVQVLYGTAAAGAVWRRPQHSAWLGDSGQEH